ncbi:sensor histidine kinase [Thermoactinospora rubra]|uniref:sensor histidine kinase n=1 Tax=Thermoactinospora rubra TaxID=1088767 RepID=UPI000A121E25|nr:histidine kinase [Thermoactinospora rubra]
MKTKDLFTALIVATVQVVLSMGAAWGQRSWREPLDAYAYALLLAGPVMLVARRRFPVASAVVTLLATYAFVVGGYPMGPVFLSPVIMLVALLLDGRRPIAWGMAGVTLAFFLGYSWTLGRHDVFHTMAVTAFILLVMLGGELAGIVRERRREAHRAREEEARRQASEERLTMAQELHDVLAHNISLIHVQASTALHLIDEHPEQARTALATIKSASKNVLGEMRSVLNVLREGAPRAPTSGLYHLDELVQRSGLDVTLKRVGSRPLPAGVERAAYRIVQEALTNVTKHAPGAKVTVRLEYAPRELLVQVTDTGGTKPPMLAGESGGNGIPGMRERAAALGGDFTAGPFDGGFRVEARFPLEDS